MRRRQHHKGWNEIKTNDSWAIFKIMGEFVNGYEKLSQIGPCVSIFGSARTKAGSPAYELGVRVARKISENGYGVITGGGPGISTEMLSIYTYRINFRDWDLGYGAVCAFMVYLVVLIMCSVFYKAVYWNEGRSKMAGKAAS